MKLYFIKQYISHKSPNVLFKRTSQMKDMTRLLSASVKYVGILTRNSTEFTIGGIS